MIFFKRIGLVTMVLVALIVINIQSAYSQQEKHSIISHLEFNIGYSYMLEPAQASNISLQADYKVNRFLAPGFSYMHSVEFNAFEYGSKNNFFGLGCKIHIMPLLLEQSDYFRFDFYVKPSLEYLYVNGYSMVEDDHWIESDDSFTYFTLGTGLVFYPWKRVGLSTDCTWFLLNEQLFTRLSFGLNVRF